MRRTSDWSVDLDSLLVYIYIHAEADLGRLCFLRVCLLNLLLIDLKLKGRGE